jgi:hypothetical protein
MADDWDRILVIQWILVSVLVFAIKAEFELRTTRGKV